MINQALQTGLAVEWTQRKTPARTFVRGLSGGARRNRTADLLNAIQALSQLSYGPETGVERAGFGRPAVSRARNIVTCATPIKHGVSTSAHRSA